MRYQDDYEELIAYIEGSLDELAAVRLEKRLAESASLRAELIWLKELMSDAEIARPASPSINVVDDVLAKISEAQEDVDYSILADELDGMGAVSFAGKNVSQDFGKRFDREWLQAFMTGCRELREEHARRVPRLDFVENVLAVIDKSEASTKHSSRLNKSDYPRVNLKSLGWLVAAAAAVVLLSSFVYFRVWLAEEKGDSSILISQRQSRGSSGLEVYPSASVPASTYSALREPVSKPWRTAETTSSVFEAVSPPELQSLKPEVLVATWRRVGSDPNAWTKIRQWASLSAEQAKDIFAAKQHLPEALVGASVALMPEEREIALVTAIGRMPSDPAVRFSLAKTYASTPERSAKAQEVLSAVENLDRENALPLYMEARIRLEAGDVSGALEVLNQAAALNRASAYALRSAQFREQALVASGLSPETARLLTAMTAGMDEYDFLCQLGHDLLQYGRYYADNGDAETAESIYESVRRLGQQLNMGADFLPEQMAALEVERQATVLMQDLYAALGSAEGVEALTAQALDLIGRIEGIEGFARAIEDFLSATTDVNTWLGWAEALLGAGVKPLFDMFRVGRFNVSDFINTVTAPKSLMKALQDIQGL